MIQNNQAIVYQTAVLINFTYPFLMNAIFSVLIMECNLSNTHQILEHVIVVKINLCIKLQLAVHLIVIFGMQFRLKIRLEFANVTTNFLILIYNNVQIHVTIDISVRINYIVYKIAAIMNKTMELIVIAKMGMS